MRSVFVFLGTLFLILGIVGILLPLIPTTPFLLLAAACYARGSDVFYKWLINHKLFGNIIRNYRNGDGIPKRAKIYTLLVLWIAIAISAFLFSSTPWLVILLCAIAMAVTIYLIKLPTAVQILKNLH